MLQSVELSKLIKISIGIGGFGLISTGTGFIYVESQFRKHEFYKASLKMLRNYPPGMKLLGEPIRSKNLNHFSRQNWIRATEAKLTIPVKGRHRHGTLYTWGSRPSKDESFTVDKCELDVCEKRWTFYLNPATGKDTSVVQQHVAHTADELNTILSESDRKHKQLLAEHHTP